MPENKFIGSHGDFEKCQSSAKMSLPTICHSVDGFNARLGPTTQTASGAWAKVELTQQPELVIGGYTPPAGSRKYFGALLVGYQGRGSKLQRFHMLHVGPW
jgi:hypothetical protein